MLRLHGVHAGYGAIEVLHGVDLVVPAGATVAVVGANGAGKTTLLRVAAGLTRATSGTVELFGDTVDALPVHERSARGLCLIPEGRGIFSQLTVRENIAMFAGRTRVDDAVERICGAFPVLAERLGQPAGRLSGGQQQMLALGRALLTGARVILADELSIGLAPVVVDEIFAALDDLRRRGRALLIVEQYVDRALSIADYVYVLHKGRVVFVGEPQQCHGGDMLGRYLGAHAAGAVG